MYSQNTLYDSFIRHFFLGFFFAFILNKCERCLKIYIWSQISSKGSIIRGVRNHTGGCGKCLGDITRSDLMQCGDVEINEVIIKGR